MIRVMQNGRYLEKNGKFFPYLADTAWTMPQRLTRAEICFYLDKRSEQSFNAVQVSAISELDGIRIPNTENNLPFINQDVSRPNPDYFELLAFIADECEKREMVTVLLPFWGDKFNKMWGVGPEIFTPENAACYGEYLASFIGERENIIWMLGGDRPISCTTHRRIIDETARGLRKGERVRHLITYHPSGESSSADFLCDADYLDFHSLQSSHSFGGFNSEKLLQKTMGMSPLPCMDAECFYEDIPIDFDLSRNYRLSARDIRRRIYKNMMVGAFGHTYGHHSVWCFIDKSDKEYPHTWQQALERPMANQMRNINKLLSKIDITESSVYNDVVNGMARKGRDYILVYLDGCEPCFLKAQEEKISSLIWFDTVSGDFESGKLNSSEKPTLISPFNNDAIAILKW